jgi:outer membrane protein OmpA-like peptidoglycan-associated protein
VEQVFLIHRETGLLLRHLVAGEVSSPDADMISAMLTAIEEFISDSFQTPPYQRLDTIQIGDLTILVEQGPLALLAGVVRGSPPETLRATFRDTLETIHLTLGTALRNFEGDDTPFAAAVPLLESCLRAHYKTKSARPSPLLWLVLALLVGVLAWWGHQVFRSRATWSRYLEQLVAEPGIVVTASGRRNGKYWVAGLRDPLATRPDALLEAAGLNAAQVVGRWEPYQALDPPFVLARAAAALSPPESVALTFREGTLRVSGTADEEWIARCRMLAPTIAGVSRFEQTDLKPFERPVEPLVEIRDRLRPPPTVALAFEAGRLTARGSAPHRWILSARDTAVTLPQVAVYDDQDLADSDALELDALVADVEKTRLHFAADTDIVAQDREQVLPGLVEKLLRLQSLADIIQAPVRVTLTGHTDTTGTKEYNLRLSRERAEVLRSELLAAGIDPKMLETEGVGDSRPLPAALAEPGGERRVTFSVSGVPPR